MDYQCRCCATAYWQELVGEADEQIDLLSESVNNIPDTVSQGLEFMKPPEARTKNRSLQEQQAAREQRRLGDNARKAKQLADQDFPNEKWERVEDGIYLSPNRPVGKKSNYQEEKRDAQILRSYGSTVYLVPDDSRAPGRKYDAIVNGQHFEFKNMHGASEKTLRFHFLKARGQAKNVFLNLEKSPLSKSEVVKVIRGARNSVDYQKYNGFKGGKIILKMNGHKNLIYLNVDDLKTNR
jgi:hypothetical protein